MGDSADADERLAIQDTIQRYALAVDAQRFELFDDTFSDDALLDYRSAGGPCGDRDAIRDWLARSRAGLIQWQHHLSPPAIELHGERANARTDVYTPNVYRDPEGRVRVLHTGGRYHDELARTPQGWRIVRRRYENTWVDGEGAGAMIPDPTRAGGRDGGA
jgi:SnoaL-like protein